MLLLRLRLQLNNLNLCTRDGNGIHNGLKNRCRKAWGFESLRVYLWRCIRKAQEPVLETGGKRLWVRLPSPSLGIGGNGIRSRFKIYRVQLMWVQVPHSELQRRTGRWNENRNESRIANICACGRQVIHQTFNLEHVGAVPIRRTDAPV